MNLTESIKQKAIDLGFDLVGITGAEAIDAGQIEYLSSWLTAGHAAQMQYMHRNFEKRTNPAELLAGAKSVICVALNYKPPTPKQTPPESTSTKYAGIANYALYEDYHPFIKKRLRKLVDFINASIRPDKWRFKICVDSAPLAERALARRAGLGFVGKNHMLINPRLGLQILLGELITDLKLDCDSPISNHCPHCNKCVEACPTGALDIKGGFNANKCISYLTVEHKTQIPDSLAAELGNHIFGCDECILACPHEINAPPCANKDFRFFDERRQIGPAQIPAWDAAKFDEYFATSVVKRLGLEKLKRNAKICLADAGSRQGARKISSSPQGTSQPE
jgi:epoxyqueuosine reductase